jgi:hypothetical protein
MFQLPVTLKIVFYVVSYIGDDEKLSETSWRNDRYGYCCSVGDFPLLLHCVQRWFVVSVMIFQLTVSTDEVRTSYAKTKYFVCKDEVLRIRSTSPCILYGEVLLVRRQSTSYSKTKHFTLEVLFEKWGCNRTPVDSSQNTINKPSNEPLQNCSGGNA